MARLYSHFYRVIQDIQGNIVPGVQGTITLADTPTLAVLYGDPEGTIPLPNPLFNSTQYGSFSVYLDTGHYDMSFLKEGYVFEPLQDIQISEASGGVASLVGTPNRVLVSQSVGDIVLSAPQDLHPDASLQFAHLGLGTPANGSLGLIVATGATFQAPITTSSITCQSTLSVASTLDVTGGGTLRSGVYVPDRAGDNLIGLYSQVATGGGTNRWSVYTGSAPAHFGGNLECSGTFYAAGAATCSSTLYVGGATTLQTTLSVGGAAGFGAITYLGDPATSRNTLGLGSMAVQAHTAVTIVGGSVTGLGSFSAGGGVSAGFIASLTGSLYVSNLVGIRTTTPSYPLHVAGDLYATHIASGTFAPFQWNYDLGGVAVYAHSLLGVAIGATSPSFTFHLNGSAGKPGGGAFADSSYRSMKTAIDDIPDALALLLSQHGRQYEWTEETRATLLPGVRYGFIEDEVTLPQWREATMDGGVAIAANGFEALAVEALRALVTRLETLEGLLNV